MVDDGFGGVGWRFDEPTQSVPCVWTVLVVGPFGAGDADLRTPSLEEGFLGEDLVVTQCLFPLDELMGGGVDASVWTGGKERLFPIVILVP